MTGPVDGVKVTVMVQVAVGTSVEHVVADWKHGSVEAGVPI